MRNRRCVATCVSTSAASMLNALSKVVLQGALMLNLTSVSVGMQVDASGNVRDYWAAILPGAVAEHDAKVIPQCIHTSPWWHMTVLIVT